MTLPDEPAGKKTIEVEYTDWGTYRYYATFAVSFGYRGKRVVAADDPGIQVRRIWADGRIIYDKASGAISRGIGWYFLPGHEDQVVPNAEDERLPYRGQIVLWFSNYPLGESPSGIPQISAEFWDEEEFTVGSALETLASHAGYEDGQVEIVGLGESIVGYLVDGSATLESVASDLGYLWNFQMVEVAAGIRFINNYVDGALDVTVVVPEGEQAVLTEGGDFRLGSTERSADQGIPARITVEYFDIDARYETGVQVVQRFTSTDVVTHNSETDVSFSLPIVSDGETMRGLAFDALYRQWGERNGHSIRLSPEYVGIDPGDVIEWTEYGAVYSAMAVKVTVNADHSVSLSLVERSANYSAIGVATTPPPDVDTVIVPSPVMVALFDVPDTHPDQEIEGYVNLRAAIRRVDPEEGVWRGARFDMTRVDQPNGWLPRFTLDDETNEHLVATLVSDDGDTITVNLGNFTTEDIEGTVGFYYVIGSGGTCEVFTFDTATEVSPGVYELSDLDRGLFGTDDFVNSHVPGDYLAMHDDLTVVPIPVSDYVNRRTFFYRAVAAFQESDEADVGLYTPTAASRKPYSPDNLRMVRLEDGSLLVEWDEDPRFSGEELPHTYSIDIYSPDWSTIVRRVPVIVGTSWSYRLPNQMVDLYNGVDTINMLVFQLHPTIGRGFPGGGTITVSDGELAVTIVAPASLLANLDGGAVPVALEATIEAPATLAADLLAIAPELLEATIEAPATLAADLDTTMDPHRYWRINATSFSGGVGTGTGLADWSEVEFLVAGVDQTTGLGTGQFSASSVNAAGLEADKAFDNNTSTRWASVSTTPPHTLVVDFGAGNEKAIDAVSIRNANVGGAADARSPMNFTVDWSDDNSTWTTAWSVTGSKDWAVLEKRTFPFPQDGDVAYRHWRIKLTSFSAGIGAGVSLADWAEVEFMIGGTDQTAGLGTGQFSASSVFGAGLEADKAFDDTLTSRWASNNAAPPHWIAVDFGAGNEKAINSVSIRANNQGTVTANQRAPAAFDVEYSSDGSTWNVALSVSGQSSWTNLERREFLI